MWPSAAGPSVGFVHLLASILCPKVDHWPTCAQTQLPDLPFRCLDFCPKIIYWILVGMKLIIILIKPVPGVIIYADYDSTAKWSKQYPEYYYDNCCFGEYYEENFFHDCRIYRVPTLQPTFLLLLLQKPLSRSSKNIHDPSITINISYIVRKWTEPGFIWRWQRHIQIQRQGTEKTKHMLFFSKSRRCKDIMTFSVHHQCIISASLVHHQCTIWLSIAFKISSF